MIDRILDRAIDKALGEVGIEEGDESLRDVLKMAAKVGAGLLMAKASGKLTVAHVILAADIVKEVLEFCEVPEEKQPELEEDVLRVVVKHWREYSLRED